MKTRVILLAIAWLSVVSVWAAPALTTPAEAKRFSTYTTYDEVLAFLSALAAADPRIRVGVAGHTLEGASQGARGRDFVCCRVASSPVPGAPRRKLRVMVTASQHGDEQSGVEAVLRLLRDVSAGRTNDLLRELELLVFPTANPWGTDRNRRENEQGLDLNRDHIKLEAPQTESMHRIFASWLPEVTYDLHEKGFDYYQVNVGTVTNLNIHPEIAAFSRRLILPAMEKQLIERSLTFHEYIIQSYSGDVSAAGVLLPDPGKREDLYRWSTTDINDGRNSYGIFGTFSFIQEIASRGDLASYGERVGHQFEGLLAFLRTTAANAAAIQAIVSASRERLAQPAAGQGDVILRMEYVRDPAAPTLRIMRLSAEPEALGTARRDIAKGEAVTSADLQAADGKRQAREKVLSAWYPRVEARLVRSRPAGYLIPADRAAVADLLVSLGVQVSIVDRGPTAAAQAYRLVAVTPAGADYLAPSAIQVEALPVSAGARNGDFFVSTSQPAAALIALLLEPESEFGLVRYGKFKLDPRPGILHPILRLERTPAWSLIPYRRFAFFGF